MSEFNQLNLEESLRRLQQQCKVLENWKPQHIMPEQPTESRMHLAVRQEMECSDAKARSERESWFWRYTLPPVSVLARQSRPDRDALIAHFRAKELREIADATNEGHRYNAGLARKRLQRVDEIARAFAEVADSAA